MNSSIPLEDTSEQSQFAQSASDMNRILDSSADRGRAKFTASFQDKRQTPSDRVFADSLPVDYPSLQHFVSQSHGYASNFDYGGPRSAVGRPSGE